MDNIVFLIFRRMRPPLITLLLVYAISVLGLVLIPGQDDAGNVWHMDFFHAFYFVSYTSTTIGFGELPYRFTDAQRLWVTITMYASVISWLYAIGTILALVQNKTFQRALGEIKLARHIRGQREPFYLVCGYGETGSALVKGLTEVGQHAVVIEIDEFRSHVISLDNLQVFVPVLNGDARKPLHLQQAGIQNPNCKAVVAVTNDNEANLKIAITSKLLHPHIKVICRADSHDVEKNMASFGTDYIIDPFDTFATYLATSFQVPCLYLLQSWLFSGSDERELDEPVYPPRDKRWIVCGYGRFGKAVYERLKKEGLQVVVIEANPDATGIPKGGVIKGRGTEADTLLEAGIDQACGLIAGTDNDANNLSIVVTARELNADIFVVLRQNHSDNSAIIQAVNADMVMHPSTIIARKIRVLLGTPMLHEFVSMAYHQENEWACELISRISALLRNHGPNIEEISINATEAGAVTKVLAKGGSVTLAEVLHDPWDKVKKLSCIVLLMERHGERILLPPVETEIRKGDRLLFCAGRNLTRLYWNLQQDNILSYVRTGKVENEGWLWRKFKRKG
jgi:Trk K+ transport system NAD-binding subunit